MVGNEAIPREIQSAERLMTFFGGDPMIGTVLVICIIVLCVLSYLAYKNNDV
jgi:hypothetical protein